MNKPKKSKQTLVSINLSDIEVKLWKNAQSNKRLTICQEIWSNLAASLGLNFASRLLTLLNDD